MKIDDLTEMQRYWLYDKKKLTFPWHTFDERRNGALFFPNGGFPGEYQKWEIKKWGLEQVYLDRFGIRVPGKKPPANVIKKIANVAKLMLQKKIIVLYGNTEILASVVQGIIGTYVLTTGQGMVYTDTHQFIQMFKRISPEYNMDDEFLKYRGRIYDNFTIWAGLTRQHPFAQSHSGLVEEIIEARMKLGMIFTVPYNSVRRKRNVTERKDVLSKIDNSIGEEVADALDMVAMFLSIDDAPAESFKEPELQALAKGKTARATRLTTDAPEEV